MLGFNYRMTDIQGALGISQMNKAETIIRGRQEAASRYDRLLQEIREIVIPFVPEGHVHSYQSYVCQYKTNVAEVKNESDIGWGRIDELNKERNQLMSALERKGVSVRQGTHAVHTLGYYKCKYGLSDYDFPCSYIADRLSLTLPLYYEITEQEQLHVVDCIKECAKAF